MASDIRERVILPIVMPLALLTGIAAIVGFIAWLLLYSTKDLAVMVAMVAAAVVLAGTALATTRDKTDGKQKGVIGAAAGIPMVLAALAAGGVIGNIDDADRVINVEAHVVGIVAPDDAPVIIAADATQFTTREIDLPSTGTVAFVFDNEHDGTLHNVQIFAGEDSSAPVFFNGALITGISTADYGFEAPGEEVTYAYNCIVHPNMTGVVNFKADAQGGQVN